MRTKPARRHAGSFLHASLALITAPCVAGCRAEGPAYDPLAYLAIGVDPHEEAAAEEGALRERGYRVLARIDGRHFVALGAASGDVGPTAVRILTKNGIALGVDAPARARPTWRRVELVESPGGIDLDFDEDRAPEVLLRVTDSMRARPCYVVVRIRESSRGDAFEVPVDARAYGASACVEEVTDVDRDGVVELLVGHRPWVVRGAPVPRLLVPFVPHQGEFVPGSEAQRRDVAIREAGALREELAHARARSDANEILRLAAEIALAEGAVGLSQADRRSSFDAAIEGVQFDEHCAELVSLVRAELAR